MFVTVRILIKNSIMLPFCSYTSTYIILNYEVLCYMGWQLQDGSMLIGTSVCNVISLNPEVGKHTSSNNPDANKTRNDDDTPSYA
jgi:hypothetical protein